MSDEINGMKEVAKALEKLQLELEPIRDKALDEVARLTGYSQCAEQFIKMIVSRMANVHNQIRDLEEKAKVKMEEEDKMVVNTHKKKK
jgi:hypothetical protein